MTGSTHRIDIDESRALIDQPEVGHNRWHEGIKPVIHARSGDRVVMQTRDAFDGQVTPHSTAEEVGKLDLGPVHPLTGPVLVEDAEEGDLLEVRVVDIVPATFGYTVQVPGFGFLADHFPDPHIVRWTIRDGFAESADLPGVRVGYHAHPGVIGLAPSRTLRERINARETDLASRGGAVLLPDARGAVPGDPEIAGHALRTIPPREIAGNIDIKQLNRGTSIYLPVSAAGALFSVGDVHFAQGDSETCGTAIEMRSESTFEFHLHKGAAASKGIRSFYLARTGTDAPPYSIAPGRFVAIPGMPLDADGTNHDRDATLAAKNALLGMIEYIVREHGYTRQQAYAICSVAVDLKVSELVDVPNFIVTAFLPLEIFV
jgi:formamidase